MTDVALIGAGPYGLSIAAHLKTRGIRFRIFGKAMDTWLAHMPRGMRLKSEGFASGLYDPGSTFTLAKYLRGKASLMPIWEFRLRLRCFPHTDWNSRSDSCRSSRTTVPFPSSAPRRGSELVSAMEGR